MNGLAGNQEATVLKQEPIIGQTQSFFQKSSSVIQSSPKGLATYNETEANQMKINHLAGGAAHDQFLMAGEYSQKGQLTPKIDGKLGATIQVKDQGGEFALSKVGDEISLYTEQKPSNEGEVLDNQSIFDNDLYLSSESSSLPNSFVNEKIFEDHKIQADSFLLGSRESGDSSEIDINGLDLKAEDSTLDKFVPGNSLIKLDSREAKIYDKLKNSIWFSGVNIAAQNESVIPEKNVSKIEDLENKLDLSADLINSDLNLKFMNKDSQVLSFEDKFEKLDNEDFGFNSKEELKLDSSAKSEIKMQGNSEDKNKDDFSNAHVGQSTEGIREKPDVAKISSNFNLNSINAKKNELADPNLKQILNQAQYMIRKGGGIVNVQMNPEGLGKVQLTVLVENGKVNLALSAQTDEAKKLLEGGISELKSQLSQHKLLVENVRVDVTHSARNPDQQQMDFSNQQNARDQARQFMGQFRENSWSGRGDSFYEMTGINSYKSQKTEPPLQPANSKEVKTRANISGLGLNLVA
jgi:hypothetical protein